ncbi:MAG: lectin like domain-containing protein [Butyrivibrio sp.]
MKKRKKIYLILVLVIALVLGIKYMSSLYDVKIVPGMTTMVRANEWNSLISDKVNEEKISVYVDGKMTEVDKSDIFMNDDMEVMINCRLLTPLFSCAVNRQYTSTVVVEKADKQLIITAGADIVVSGGKEISVKSKAQIVDGEIFIPASYISTFLSYQFEWDYRNLSAEFTNQKPDEKIYPYYYSYRDSNKISRVKNQKDLGTCWAFASLTALESTMMPENREDFSEDHMSCHNGYNLDQSQGGTYNMSMAYLASWMGPVRESDDPYGDGISPDGLEAAYHVQEMQIISSKNYDGIKKAVFLYGGVQSSLYMSLSDSYGNSSAAYNADTSAYCYIGTEKANHDVVIIGWDDGYPASNFATQPEGDGAFICMNSWGEEFGEKGYFYVSYYDSNIGVRNLVYTKVENTDNYDNIYQTDKCGWIGQLGYNREYAYFSNIYEAEGDETLEAVGFYATGENTEYEVYFVNNFEDTSSFADRELIAKGSFSNAGYYTVKTDKEILLMSGSKYAVIVYISTPNSVLPIAIEYRADSSTSTVDISDGEGYISLHGSIWERVEETQNCNVCLKMYTKDYIEGEDEQ